MLSTHDLMTVVLVYLAIGASGWSMLFASGAIQQTYRNRPHQVPAILLASIWVITLWPFVLTGTVRAWLKRSGYRGSRR